MQKSTFKRSVLWMNIGDVAAQTGIWGHSFYKCAHFQDNCKVSCNSCPDGQGAFHTTIHDNCCMFPQTPVLSA